MSRPKLLIEQWLPIEAIGAECMRERGASSALPPLYFLHVWWARRPLTVSRAAILASLLPAYPSDKDPGVRRFPKRFVSLFPNIDSYKAWFIRLIGILGDPVAGKKLVEWAKKENKKLNFNPYGYARAFTINPSEKQLEQLYDLLEWIWGTREITFCDPMAGGGSIPFEALRYGLTVHANELNPVASVILKATLDHPARLGPSLVEDIKKYGKLWCDRVRERLEPYFPLRRPDENIFCYLWARTVAGPETGKLVPLSPNWWLRKGSDPVAVKVITDPSEDRCRFQIVRGAVACKKADPDKGTVRRGTGVSPWTGATLTGEYIKAEAQAGRMGRQLFAVGTKRPGGFVFRPPTSEDQAGIEQASREYRRKTPRWTAEGLLPDFDIPYGHRSHERDVIVQYGLSRWTDLFSERQLLFHCMSAEVLRELSKLSESECDPERAKAIQTYLAIAADKCVDYNSGLVRWDGTRDKIANSFDRHDFSFKWSNAEFDASRNLVPWAVSQVADAYSGLARLLGADDVRIPTHVRDAIQIIFTQGPAQSLSLEAGSIRCIVVDPPYYNNVNYAELSDLFYVWLRSNAGRLHPELFRDILTPKDEEATANPARFRGQGTAKKRMELAEKDYENKMMTCFREMNRVLHSDGVLTVMFTHKRVEAWDTLGSALMRAGFRIDASWPVHTESEASLHQAKKNAAASTILLVCRKREASSESAWWDDLKGKVKETARETAKRFEAEGIRGVDLYISTFGPVLSIISER
jgi:adenine-specific DNA methylase